jgi:HD-GYP domain-containing protein (c-di-GMP phosphodiesterase class II)
VVNCSDGHTAATTEVQARRGKWFDPEVVDAKSPYTAGHSARVGLYTALLGESLDIPEARRRCGGTRATPKPSWDASATSTNWRECRPRTMSASMAAATPWA